MHDNDTGLKSAWTLDDNDFFVEQFACPSQFCIPVIVGRKIFSHDNLHICRQVFDRKYSRIFLKFEQRFYFFLFRSLD